MLDVFQDTMMVDGGAEAVLRAALPGLPPTTLTIGIEQHGVAGLGPRTVMAKLRPSADDRYALLAQTVQAVLRLPPLAHALLSFHHHFGLLVSSRRRATYFVHTPTRVLHEPARVPWEVPHFTPEVVSEMRAREDVNLANAHTVITNSQATRRRVMDHYGIDPVVLHPPTSLWAVPPRAVEPARRPYVLTVTRVARSKALLPCASVIAGAGFDWLVVGDGDHAVLEGSPGVQLVGRQARQTVADLIACAAVCLSPGLEDFGLFAAEAVTCGRPAVARRGSGVFDVADGALYAFGDPDEDGGASLARALGDAAGRAPDRARVQDVRIALAPDRFARSLAELAT